jgi:hypothetical protein
VSYLIQIDDDKEEPSFYTEFRLRSLDMTEAEYQEYLKQRAKKLHWTPEYAEPSPGVPYNDEELQKQYAMRDQIRQQARNANQSQVPSLPDPKLPSDAQQFLDTPGQSVLGQEAPDEDTEHAFNLGGWLKEMGSSVLGSVDSGLSGLGDWMQKNPALVSSIAMGLGRYAWDPDVGRGPMGGWSNKRALWNSMGTALNARAGFENLANPRGQLMYKDGGFYNVRPTNIGGRPSYSVNQLYQTPTKGTSVATGKVEYKPIGGGMQQGQMFNQFGRNQWTPWGEPKPLYEPKDRKPVTRKVPLKDGKIQEQSLDSKGNWVDVGVPYDRHKSDVLSPEAYKQKVGIAKAGADNTYGTWEKKEQFKKQQEAPKAFNAFKDYIRKAEFIDTTIDDTIKMISGWSVGWGSLLKYLPETQANALSKKLDTIRANIGFEELQRMRDNSPTGGALGQVSEMENKLLQAVQGSIDQDQDPAQLIETLKDIQRKYRGAKDRLGQAYDKDFGKIYPRQFKKTGSKDSYTKRPWVKWLHNNPGKADDEVNRNKTITVGEGSYKGRYTSRQLPNGSWEWFKE